MDSKISCLNSGHFEDGERLREIDQLGLHSLENFDCKRSTCRETVSPFQVAIKAVRHIEPIKPICGGGPNFSNGSAATASPPRFYTPNFKSSPPRQDKDPGGPPGGLIVHTTISLRSNPPSLLTGAVDLPLGSQSRDLRILG